MESLDHNVLMFITSASLSAIGYTFTYPLEDQLLEVLSSRHSHLGYHDYLCWQVLDTHHFISRSEISMVTWIIYHGLDWLIFMYISPDSIPFVWDIFLSGIYQCHLLMMIKWHAKLFQITDLFVGKPPLLRTPSQRASNVELWCFLCCCCYYYYYLLLLLSIIIIYYN